MSNEISVVRSGDTAKINFARSLTRRFECRMCGCVFDATNDNSDDNKAFTTHVAKNGTTYYKSICPDCGGEVTIFGAVREIVQGTKARNPDGSVNYTRIDLK